MRARTWQGLVLALALGVGDSACRDASSSAAPGEVRWLDGGGAELAIGSATVALPPGELAAQARPKVNHDEAGKRYALTTATGEARTAYVVGGNVYLGPMSKSSDAKSAPDTTSALGALFANAGDRSAQLVADVGKDMGEAGVVRLLVDGAASPRREWDDAYAKLPEGRAAEVRAGLAPLLERGRPTAGLRRAVALLPLKDAALLAGRVRELLEPVREPRAAAVMLRAVTAIDKAQGAALGCEVVSKMPFDKNLAGDPPEVFDHAGREALVEAATLAVAAAGLDCPKVQAALGDDVCVPTFRCGPNGPLDGSGESKQDEPLCTKADIDAQITRELARTAADVLTSARGTRKELFAYGALLATDKLPPAFAIAHGRRRYAVVQPKEPACDTGMSPGTSCHCDEAMLRDQACRHQEAKAVSVGICKFEIDDKTKKLTNVVAALPP